MLNGRLGSLLSHDRDAQYVFLARNLAGEAFCKQARSRMRNGAPRTSKSWHKKQLTLTTRACQSQFAFCASSCGFVWLFQMIMVALHSQSRRVYMYYLSRRERQRNEFTFQWRALRKVSNANCFIRKSVDGNCCTQSRPCFGAKEGRLASREPQLRAETCVGLASLSFSPPGPARYSLLIALSEGSRM